MARVKMPNPLERRHLVEQELAADKALAIAELYLADERGVEAVDFLRLAGAEEKLAELRESAISEGDVFLLRAVAGAQDEPPSAAEWERAAAAADSKGLGHYAVEARRQAARGHEG